MDKIEMKKRRGPMPAPDKHEWQRATFWVRNKHLLEFKSRAYRDRKSFKKLLDEILAAYFRHKVPSTRR